MLPETHPALATLLCAYLDRSTGQETEDERLVAFLTGNDEDYVADADDQLRDLLGREELPVKEIRMLANRELADQAEARQWLQSVLDRLSR